VELIVQPDAHDVVGEMAADQDRAQKRIAERYFEEEPGRRLAAKLLSKDEARRISPSCQNC
jgi:hypothetical protein